MDAELRAACAQALHVVRADGEALRAGAAVLFVLDRLGWCTAARLLGSRPLLPVVEAGYRWVAGHRALLARAFRL
jgi:predicted DCC family thiol-disulfide oxidoreductase YuxK